MTKSVRAVLIDPEKQAISDIEVHPKSSIKQLEGLVGADTLAFFRIADHGPSFDQACVDDKGLADGAPIYAFTFSNRIDPIAGRCVILGEDRLGTMVDAAIPLSFLKEHVSWIGRIIPKVEWKRTERGQRAVVTYEKAPLQ